MTHTPRAFNQIDVDNQRAGHTFTYRGYLELVRFGVGTMDMGYLFIILAVLQAAIVFLPIPKNVRYKNFLSLFIQIAFLIGIGFYLLSNSASTAIYLTIPCFLLIFLLPRFGKLFSHLSAT